MKLLKVMDGRQVVSYNDKVSFPVYINTGIVQGSGIGPMCML